MLFRSPGRVKAPVPVGISFYGDYYLSRVEEQVVAFSTRCSHAGCTLKQETDGVIACPCHGSRFEAVSGKPLKGPAMKPLRHLSCRFDSTNKEWVIGG